MAAVSLLGSLFNTTSGTHTVTATPAVGDLIVIIAANTGYTGTVLPTDDNSDGNGTYTLVNTNTKASGADTLQMYVRDKLIGSATSTIFSHAPGTTTGGGIGVVKITGMTRAGSLAVRQSAVESGGAGQKPVPTFGVAATGSNPLVGCVFDASNPAGETQPATWDAELLDTGWATPTAGIQIAKDDTGNTGTTQLWAVNSPTAFCDIAAEFDSTAAPPSDAPSERRRRRQRVLQRMV